MVLVLTITQVYVARGAKHECTVAVKKKDQHLVWRFLVEDYDIDFSVLFTPSMDHYGYAQEDDGPEPVVVHAVTRYSADRRPVESLYECPGIGIATLTWDNTYSRLRGYVVLL